MPTSRLARAVAGVLDLFVPPLCLLCDTPLAGLRPEVCQACRSAMRRPRPPLCLRCGIPAALAMGSDEPCRACQGWEALAGARSAYLLAGPVRSWIHQLKYEGMTGLAALAGEALQEALEGTPPEWGGAAALVPVPLYSARRRERGFNQSELLAAELGERVGLPVLSVLERRRPTAPQVGLPAGQRRANVAGAFRVREPFAAFCRGRAFLLVDDVLTTGSTLDAAAQAIALGGGGPARAVVAARAMPGADG